MHLLKDPHTKGSLRKHEDCALPGQGDEEAIMMLFYGFLQDWLGRQRQREAESDLTVQTQHPTCHPWVKPEKRWKTRDRE